MQSQRPTFTRVLVLLVLGAALAANVGCPKKEGPAERAGKMVDDAGRSVGNAADDIGDGIEDAADELGD